MNIIDAKELYTESEQLEKLDKLCDFYKKIGDDVTAGYLGSAVTNIRFDDNSNLEFQTLHKSSDLETLSTGALLDDGVVIKQIQRNSKGNYFQLFSWSKDFSKYTYLLFDDMLAMDSVYNILKGANANLCTEDFSECLRSLNIPVDNILQVKENVKVDTVDNFELNKGTGEYSPKSR